MCKKDLSLASPMKRGKVTYIWIRGCLVKQPFGEPVIFKILDWVSLLLLLV